MGSQTIKFLGTLYGEPLQVSKMPYTSDAPVVSFVGNTPRPYVWIGSPDKSVANNGVADDVWALFDPDVHVYDGGIPQVVTGMNHSGLMGGSKIDSNKILWVSRPESDSRSPWHYVEATPTNVTETAVTGNVVAGNVNDLRLVEGK
jgi:hypothetical protein